MSDHATDCRRCRGTGMVCEEHPGFPLEVCCDNPVGAHCPGPDADPDDQPMGGVVQAADIVVRLARTGHTEDIHDVTDRMTRAGMRAVIAALATAYGAATSETADVWSALLAAQEAEMRRSA